MTEAQAIEAIYLRWADGWAALHPSLSSDPNHVPYTLRGESYKPEPLGVLGAWARVSVTHTTAQQMTQGQAPSRKWERRGSVFVQLFAPVNKGQALLADLASDVRTVLEGRSIVAVGDAINTYEARTVEGDEDGTWNQSTVITRFRYVETR